MKLGKYKVWGDRLRSYLAIVQFILLCYLTIVQTDLSFTVLSLSLLLLIPIFLFIDIKCVMPGEFEYIAKKTPQWDKMFKRLDDIERKQNG